MLKISWIYHKKYWSNYWFIDIPWVNKGYFVIDKNNFWAFDGDEVEASIKIFKGREEATITKIVKYSDNVIIWEIQLVRDYGFVIVDGSSNRDIFIPPKDIDKFKLELKNKYKVWVKIISSKWKNKTWEIIKVLGPKNSKWLEELEIITRYWVDIDFPKKVVNRARNLDKTIEYKDRVDLTSKFIYTIDGIDAKDLDDAIWVERAWDDYKIYISIADVSHYIKEKSHLDKEAFKRWNSIYLVDKVIPMLPRELSNDICSLNPWVSKYTLTAEITIDKYWKVKSKKVYKSIISTKYRLTYKDVQMILDNKLNIWDHLDFDDTISTELYDSIYLSREIKNIIRQKKDKLGLLDFNFPEKKIMLDGNLDVIDIVKLDRYESMDIIEQFMILANSAVSEMFQKLPIPYRVHPEPTLDDIDDLRIFLWVFWYTLPYSKISPKTIQNIINKSKNTPNNKLIQSQILRSMQKAIYSPKNEWHYGLNLEFYSHFTSPIRRYSDLLLHRIISKKLSGSLTNRDISIYRDTLKDITKSLSEKEERAQKLEYAIEDLYIVKYYKNFIWTEYRATISQVIDNWIFVELENSVEWFIPLSQMILAMGRWPTDIDTKLKSIKFWKKTSLSIWDHILVKLFSIDSVKNKLNFDFIEKIIL